LDFVYSVNEFVSWQFWTLFGIVLEIIGFVLMTFLWGKHPRMNENYFVWIENNKKFHNKWLQEMNLVNMNEKIDSKKWYQQLPWSNMYIDEIVENKKKPSGEEYNLFVRYQEVPNRFRWYWNLRTKIFSILPVIVGLCFQGVQLLRF